MVRIKWEELNGNNVMLEVSDELIMARQFSAILSNRKQVYIEAIPI